MRFMPLAMLFSLIAAPVLAHEFWISPNAYTVAPGGTMEAEIRVGENFKGGSFPFIPPNFKRFDLVQGDTVVPVEGDIGNKPALEMTAPGEGLWVVVHQTKNLTLNYTDWAKFEKFVTHKDFAWALDEHVARGLPKEGFKELYGRYGKSLIAVGDGAGVDKPVGLLTEIVALANPYTDPLPDGLPVQVLYEGKLRTDVQVEVFARQPDGTVDVSLYRTDDQGVAVIPVQPGVEYLVDSVVMRAIEPKQRGSSVWETLWASLTFKMPG